ncbi:uncharacterized protein LOC106657833 [Trichogramma pretiosum]|uniref:uncharacterized protein LOC106657833 n=1 Tax=Trichogramma pretiosum TaxID=7493 RepID=UPI0006C9A2D2|nr:uncharacterized protein LOC106657833 [Trichogramma pretiosum]
MEDPDTCFSAGSIAGAVIGTFAVTCLLFGLAALIYRQWRRHKGKHLVLVTDPEIVEEAYAFDNPCFKDVTPATTRSLRPQNNSVLSSRTETTTNNATSTPISKEATGKWSLGSPWANIGKVIDKRRTLDDSVIGPKAARVSMVSLRSRDFTGLGFNVCGNMREGIFVKDLMHRGPASESGLINPGDQISSIKISFRSMVYEDALTILSYASPYEVELEVESGVSTPNSKPTTLLKKSSGVTPTNQRICHPLYRSQSIPELSQQSSAHRKKRLFTNDLTKDSTIKSIKSNPGVQTLERKHEEMKNHHPKFGIKVLPALDGTIHRVETQNEHNTNLERRHSRKAETDDNKRNSQVSNGKDRRIVTESTQQRSNSSGKKAVHVNDGFGIDVPDRASEIVKDNCLMIPTEVPAEVHNAAMVARRNRKSYTEQPATSKKLSAEPTASSTPDRSSKSRRDSDLEAKSPSKGKRKAPAPPASRNASLEETTSRIDNPEDQGIGASTNEEEKREEKKGQAAKQQKEDTLKMQQAMRRVQAHRVSESDTETELQQSLTNIELKPSEITIHHTPVPEVSNESDEVDEAELYRKAASLGDLSRYEAKANSQTLERAQSLDMTDPCSKKRKAPLPPPDDINESTEDLTKLDQIERRKLKKSSEWGTLEDAFWKAGQSDQSKLAKDEEQPPTDSQETSIELYNLPLSTRLTRQFIEAEKQFNAETDNSLARLLNDGTTVKAPPDERVEAEFREAHPLPPDNDQEEILLERESEPALLARACSGGNDSPSGPDFKSAVDFFEESSANTRKYETKLSLAAEQPEDLYGELEEVHEEPIVKVTQLVEPCPGCERRHESHSGICALAKDSTNDTADPSSYRQTIRLQKQDGLEEKEATLGQHDASAMERFETHYAKPIMHDFGSDDEEPDRGQEEKLDGSSCTVTINSEKLDDRANVSNVSVSSLSVDLGSESGPETGPAQKKQLTYVTEIKVMPQRAKDQEVLELNEQSLDNQEIVSFLENRKEPRPTSNGKLPLGQKPPVPPRRSDAPRYVPTTRNDERQVVYVSEYRSPAKDESRVISKDSSKEIEINPWSNGASQPQTVTNIVLSTSTEDQIINK